MNAFSKFETKLPVWPEDVDFYQRVNSTRHLHYVLAARSEQMEKHYRMSMQAFADRGLGWWVTTADINYRRPLGWGDRTTVRCRNEHFSEMGCRL